jgi:hypothetical protein
MKVADLTELIIDELSRPTEKNATTLVKIARDRVIGVKAALFYGSCLRDGITTNSIADLYLLIEDDASKKENWLIRILNRVLPPSVIYLECDGPDGKLRAKAAIITVGQFIQLTSERTFHSYFWARFAQPIRLVWAENEHLIIQIAEACKSAVLTFASETHLYPPAKSEVFWTEGFKHTYASELRSEGPDRPLQIYLADQNRYDLIFDILNSNRPIFRGTHYRKIRRQIFGKLLSVVRLLKGMSTFEGGLDYIAWKINRHSGVKVAIKPWHRRWPLIAAPGLAWSVWRRGGFK